MPDQVDLAARAFSCFGLRLSPKQVELFHKFEALLLDYNARFNLTAIRDIDGIRTRHFLDSLSLLQVLPASGSLRVVDVGTGAGFPGIPLKIMLPAIHLTLVESIGKKANFCQLVVDELGLSDVRVLNTRAEELARQSGHREGYDFALARAVAGMPILAEYLLPLVKVGGTMVAQKGSSAHAESQSAVRAFNMLGASLEKVIPVELPGVSDERYLVVVRKSSPTPALYPRPAGAPVKKPLT
jgi:16S rRNA (guanine527-N7)-methyltransferase